MYFVSPLPLHNNLSKKRKNILGGVTITYAFGEEESGVYTEMKWKTHSSLFPVLNSRVICCL